MISLTPSDRAALIAQGLITLPEPSQHVTLTPDENLKDQRRRLGLCLDCGQPAKKYPDGRTGVRCTRHANKNYRTFKRWRERQA